MPYLEEFDIVLCPDCVFFLANGEMASDYDVEAIDRNWPGEEGWHLHYEWEDSGFSRQDCDGCDETLGGTRHTGTAWRQRYTDLEKLALAGEEDHAAHTG